MFTIQNAVMYKILHFTKCNAVYRAGQTRTFSRLRIVASPAQKHFYYAKRATAENDAIAKDAKGHRREILRHWRQLH